MGPFLSLWLRRQVLFKANLTTKSIGETSTSISKKKIKQHKGGRRSCGGVMTPITPLNGKLTILYFTYCMICLTASAPGSVLRFRSGSPFKIALFADLHFGENAWTDWGPLQDANSTRVISSILHHEDPDLVVYLGDVITANNIATKNASLYWDQAISPTKARDIPWASVFGNHDDAPFSWPIDWFSTAGIPQRGCRVAATSYCSSDGSEEEECDEFRSTDRSELMSNEVENNKLSQSRNGPKHLWPSVSNYYIQISPLLIHDLHSPAIMYLYFLDSGGGSYPQVISTAQLEWFRLTAQQLNPHSRVPEIVFWHIPTVAYEEAAPSSFIEKPCVGSINKEKVAAQQAEFGIMSLLEHRPSVKAVFVGHNHGLDWCCPHRTNNKLWLCFARHSGYGGYGNWPRGARILQITHQPFSLKTWIRMEDGQLHSEILLSP